MNLGKVPESDKFLDIALRRGRKEASSIGKEANRLKQEKSREIKRIEVAANYIVKYLEKTIDTFPNIKEMPPFYRELVPEIIDADAAKKALGHMQAVSKIVRALRSKYIIKVKMLGRGKEGQSKAISREFIGRLSSVVKSLNKSIEAYNKAVEKMREMPTIKTDMPTIIIAGHPNVGKSTLLGKITESKPKVASYPFTTTKLELGYFTHRYLKFQMIDTPGLLDRPSAQRNVIEKKGTAALKHLATVIIFILDPTESCGFLIGQQADLLNGIAKEFGEEKVVVYLSKTDLANAGQIEIAKNAAGKFKLVEGSMEEARNLLAGLANKAKVPLN